jgi:nitroreductase
MNETLRTIHSLRSIHGDFSSQEVMQENLETILDACLRAANASARQSYSIIVVEDRAVIKQCLGYEGSKALIFCVDYNRIAKTAKHMNHSFQVDDIIAFITGSVDVTLAAQTAAIAAKSLGIDSLFTNSIHRGDITRIPKQFQLPEKYCFPLIALILGYSAKEPKHLRGRLRKGVVHYNKYHNLTDEELEEIARDYDDPQKHLGVKENWKELGFAHYLDWFYEVWSSTDPKALPERLNQFYTLLRDTGFIESFSEKKDKYS